jgi:hypothetical protein
VKSDCRKLVIEMNCLVEAFEGRFRSRRIDGGLAVRDG